jgi:hypothetical protein
MPMIPCILSPSEAFPSASLIFFFFSLVLETLLILILVFSQEMRRNRPLIPDMPDLFFGDIASFFFLGRLRESASCLLECCHDVCPAMLIPSVKSSCRHVDRSYPSTIFTFGNGWVSTFMAYCPKINRPCSMADCICRRSFLQSPVLWVKELCHLQYNLP